MQKINKIFLYLAIFISGLTAISFQITVFRELIALFYGNELTTGIVLAVWLLSTALGTRVLVYFYRKNKISVRIVAFFQFMTAMMLAASLFLIRFIRQILSIAPGEIAGLDKIILITIMTILPLCAVLGLSFASVCMFLERRDSPHKNVSRVYFAESLGSAVGGIITSFILIRFLAPAETMIVLFILNLSISIILLLRNKPGLATTLIFITLIIASVIYSPAKKILQKAPWKNYNLISTVNSVYGRITITETGGQYNFFQNGVLLFSVPDKLTEEESVHYALLSHPAPDKVLIIGGNPSAVINETLMHKSVKHVTYVNIDPVLTGKAINLSQRLFSKQKTDSAVIKIVFSDPRRFLQKEKTNFDVIISCLPNPYNANLNRFYTSDFFRIVKNHLTPHGIMSCRAPASENALSNEQAEYLSMMYNTLTTGFKYVFTVPGQTCTFIAFKSTPDEKINKEFFIKRIKERNLQTKYVQDYYIDYQMSGERLNYLNSKIKNRGTFINYDFKPAGYYFDSILWAGTFAPQFNSVLKKMKTISFSNIITFLVISALGLIIFVFFSATKHQAFAVNYSILIVGFSEISMELIAIVCFQILYGFAYYALSLIIAAYMLGLTAGSYIASFSFLNRRRERYFIVSQLSMLLIPVFFILFLMFVKDIHTNDNFLLLLFCGFTSLSGFVGGFQFPTALHIISNNRGSTGVRASLLYSLDLAGSSAGALILSAFLIPVYGILNSIYLLVIINLSAAIAVVVRRYKLRN
ncbi:hypothetical protein DRQ07_01145 [candidate division KSB1 bacterium]|nr:MAG: hypothetical protein DRQ07_01145 [candidate division KSB1 bacterium]